MPTCPVCNGQYAESDLLGLDKEKIADVDAQRPLLGKVLLCPRCETDVCSWQLAKEKIGPIVKRPYPLVLPLLSFVQGALTGWQPHVIGIVLAIILSSVVFLMLQNQAGAFRIARWAGSFKARPGPSLEMVELGTFVIGLAAALAAIILMKYWILPPAEPDFIEKLLTSLIYSLAFILITVAFTLMLVSSQVHKLDQIVPQPVFTNTDRLLRIVMRSAREQLNLQGEPAIENVERTGDAGLRVVVSLKRKVTTTERKGEAKLTIKKPADELETVIEEAKITEQDEKGSIARWEIKADMWGRIRSIDVSDWWAFVKE